MAPAASTPRGKKRANNYFDVGVQGRKTGIVLKDSGVRDEHGIEPLDNIFSSPEKTPAKRATRSHNVTLTSEEMDVQESTIPEPTETLKARDLLRSAGKLLPPPFGRSPIKTSLGSSPRRQPSLPPSAKPQHSSSMTPNRATSHPPVRRLDFSMTETDLAHGTSPTRANGVTSSLRAAARNDIYDLQPSPGRGKKRRREDDIQEEVDVQEEELPQMNGFHDDEPMPYEDDPVQGIDEGGFPDEIEANMPDADVALVETPPSQKRHRRPQKAHVPTPTQVQEITPLRGSGAARGKQTKRGVVGESGSAVLRRDYTPEVAEEEHFAAGAPAHYSSPAARKGRRPKSLWAPAPSELEPDSGEDSGEDVYVEEVGPENIDPTLLEPDEYSRPSSKKKAASKAKTKALNVHRDLTHNDDTIQSIEMEAPPAKKARGRPKKSEQKKSAPKERNPNVPKKVVNSQKVVDRATALNRLSKGELDELLAPGRTGSTRSNVLLREETPLETDGVYKTRSGRTSVPKLDTWAGEQIHYGRDGTVQGVVRATSVEPVARRPGAGQPKSGANSKARGKKGMKAIQEEEEDLEEWEMEDGILGGWVNEWDDALNNNTGKAIEEDLAYASQGIQTREVAGANFKYCKIFAKPWFGIGMVDIPVDGMKKAKNSRRMQMAFFVIKGKVGVTVADNEFVISQGGIWQVPRGNTYSIMNAGATEARIFFAQACEKAEG